MAMLVMAAALTGTHPTARTVRTASPAAAVAQQARELSPKERLEVFDEVWRLVEEKYYDATFNGVDWNAVRERYRPLVESVVSDRDFYVLLNQMVGELHDAHTRVRSPLQRQNRRRNQATGTGVSIGEVEGKPVIYSVTAGSEAERAGIKPGMVVRTIDGQPVAQALAAARRDIGTSSSDRATRLLAYSRIIAGDPDTPLRLGLTRADGTQLEATLDRRTVSAPVRVTARLLPSGVAYIGFNRFQPPAAKQIDEALSRFKNAPGLILDIRSNGGGDGEEGLRIATLFFDHKVPAARIITRTGKPPSALFGLVKMPKEFEVGRTGGQKYSNPVVILVNEATGSAAEFFANTLQENGRALVMGTRSCGCVLGVLNPRELKGGGELTISEIGFITAHGRRLEGTGVIPDKSITETLDDLRHGHDPALEEAEKSLIRGPATGS